MTFYRLLAVALFLVLLGGCAGIVTVTSTEKDSPNVNMCLPLSSKGQLAKGHGTLDDFKSLWGAPSNVVKDGDIEEWAYNDSLAWRGVLPFVFPVAIPLMVPVGENHLIITFNQGQCIFSQRERGALSASGCGFFVGDNGSKIGCLQ